MNEWRAPHRGECTRGNVCAQCVYCVQSQFAQQGKWEKPTESEGFGFLLIQKTGLDLAQFDRKGFKHSSSL